MGGGFIPELSPRDADGDPDMPFHCPGNQKRGAATLYQVENISSVNAINTSDAWYIPRIYIHFKKHSN